MPTKTKKSPVKELGASVASRIAPTGKFIACFMPDSCMYQIGDPTIDRESAFILCAEYRGMEVGIQIFNDKGEPQIFGGKLKFD